MNEAYNFIFREHYKSYIRHTKKTFAANIEETYRSVERSKWLAGPDFLHKTVKNFRDLDNLPTKPFMEWLGIQQSLTQISGGGCWVTGLLGHQYMYIASFWENSYLNVTSS